MEHVIEVRGLRKSYGEHVAVAELDLTVAGGEIVGLIGANGAGKTTTVECIQGLRRPDAGRLRVLGLDPARDGGRLRRRIGCQLQDASLPDRIRVGEAVELFAGPIGAGDLLDRFGLTGLERRPFASLSGGERQRLFLVLALVHAPRLVILDELTQGLDPAARRTVWCAIDELRATGVTILLVTHELDEAEELCDRVVAMRAGRVLDEGSPAALVDRHGGWATTTFTMAATRVAGLGLERCDGVRDVALAGDRVTVRGDRRSIATIGAHLVATGAVPNDLAVAVPTLDDALVELLHRDRDAPAGAPLTLRGAA